MTSDTDQILSETTMVSDILTVGPVEIASSVTYGGSCRLQPNSGEATHAPPTWCRFLHIEDTI